MANSLENVISETDINRVVFEPKFHKLGGKVKPEERLPMSMLGALCFPVSPSHVAYDLS